MKRVFLNACDGFILVLGFLAVVVALSVSQRDAWGDDVKLFASPAEPVTLFQAPAAAAFEGIPKLFDFEQPFVANAQADSVRLFEPPVISPEIEHPRFAVPAAAIAAYSPSRAACQVKPDPAAKRPYLVSYGPTYCVPCGGMFNLVGKGDPRLQVNCIHADSSTFPAEIQAYGNKHGWPVHHWAAPSGKYALWHGVMTLDQLVDLVQTESGQVPKSKPVLQTVSTIPKTR